MTTTTKKNMGQDHTTKPPAALDVLKDFVKTKVPVSFRALAVDAFEMFEDRPSQNGLNDEAGALKLAWHLWKLDVQSTELLPLLMKRDRTVQWRPRVDDFLRWIEEARAAKAKAELDERLRTRVHLLTEKDGVEVLEFCDASDVAALMATGEYRMPDGIAARMEALGFTPPPSLPAPTPTPEEIADRRARVNAALRRVGVNADNVLPRDPQGTLGDE